jgi:hypothetical protein
LAKPAQTTGDIVAATDDPAVGVVFTGALCEALEHGQPMGLREEGVTTCVTWSSVPPVVPVLIHLSAAIETSKGVAASGPELLKSLETLKSINRHGDADPEEYRAIARRYERLGSADLEPTLPRDIICRILECLLLKKEPVSLLAGTKTGVPLRAWIPTELVVRVREYCKRRCSKSSFFITAATLYFEERGIAIDKTSLGATPTKPE